MGNKIFRIQQNIGPKSLPSDSKKKIYQFSCSQAMKLLLFLGPGVLYLEINGKRHPHQSGQKPAYTTLAQIHRNRHTMFYQKQGFCCLFFGPPIISRASLQSPQVQDELSARCLLPKPVEMYLDYVKQKIAS